MLLTEDQIRQIQTDANNNQLDPVAVKKLVSEVLIYRENMREIYSMCAMARREKGTRDLLTTEIWSVVNFARRICYIMLRSRSIK